MTVLAVLLAPPPMGARSPMKQLTMMMGERIALAWPTGGRLTYVSRFSRQLMCAPDFDR
jgi:hypothetical protein